MIKLSQASLTTPKAPGMLLAGGWLPCLSLTQYYYKYQGHQKIHSYNCRQKGIQSSNRLSTIMTGFQPPHILLRPIDFNEFRRLYLDLWLHWCSLKTYSKFITKFQLSSPAMTSLWNWSRNNFLQDLWKSFWNCHYFAYCDWPIMCQHLLVWNNTKCSLFPAQLFAPIWEKCIGSNIKCKGLLPAIYKTEWQSEAESKS